MAHQFTNRLVKEKSPYLLQHAHNPVDWYPWGPEAFNAAREQDKPIFLSIGYATCHWCHVMEKESFENVKLAQLLNETFINIKIDREELPEIDNLYMEFAQSMMAGSAGWPLNVLLTPDLQPFFAATYLPRHNSQGLMGLTELTTRINDVWQSENRQALITQAAKIVDVFTNHVHTRGDSIPEKFLINETIDLLFKMADPVYGGIKGAPKFPIGYQINFLLRYSYKTKDSRALFLVERTLDMMHRGGIYDHLGGGFSRYSVDEKWQIPHFEKMLYDNALLSHAYLEGWLATKRPLYKRVCQEILQYILRDMTDPEGGFYSAEDADSEGKEGYFYTWEMTELLQLLGERNLYQFCEFYGITEAGNFEGRNILHTKENEQEFATRKIMDVENLKRLLADDRKILWEVREKRVHPLKDKKILASWNGLTIFSLAEAGKALNNETYLMAAEKAANFIKTNLWRKGQLLHRYCDGESLFVATLDDYAFLIRGLISLFEANRGIHYLTWAMEMSALLDRDFKAEDGAYYQTDGKNEHLILRKCHFADGAEPSGNAIHCENLMRLYQITGDPNYLSNAEDILKAVKYYLDSYSPGYCYHLMNLQRYYDRTAPTMVISLNKNEDHLDDILKCVNENLIPHKAVVVKYSDEETLEDLIPFIKEQTPIDNQTTLYLCTQGVCQKPIHDFPEILKTLNSL